MSAGFLRADGDDLLLAIRLTPKAAKEQIGGTWRDEKGAVWLQISVRAVPERGKVNKALIQSIAERLGIAARDIVLESGDTNRLKRIRLIDHAHEAGAILQKLDPEQ
ncbi:DUF167 domain-containing protein [Sphingobium fluviale]|uniref:DUF167 domain-containing protein n=1 Tax=Sphingobium fluviale TaxID=2506423 RepID=UPI0015F2E07F|nr:DUF167 domain-containing protein [Sphingobium fluviale]